MDAQLFLTIFLWLIIGSATAYYAHQRGRDPLLWFMIGMMLGLLGLLLLFFLPNSAAESSKNPDKLSEKEEPLSSNGPSLLTHDYLIKEWFYYDKHQNRLGPVRFDILKAQWQSQEVNEESFVWCEGMTEWKKIEQIQSLYTHLALENDNV